jgi:7-keto-8-aminopelargonate synthetase-like enzyme
MNSAIPYLTAQHGVGLACPRGAIGKHTAVVALEHNVHQILEK